MKLLISLLAGAIIASSGAPAFAQKAPGGVPAGAGLQRGMLGLNNSGQAGFVTLFRRGNSTHIVTALEGTMPGRVQMVAIQRGKSCDDVKAGVVNRLADMRNGMSRGDAPMSEDRLLSGNYVVVVYSNNVPGGRPTACGQLYR